MKISFGLLDFWTSGLLDFWDFWYEAGLKSGALLPIT